MAVMGDNPSKFNGTKLPVESLNWDDAEKFCKKLTEQERELRKIPMGWIYSLPTEAEWEYACRAGTTTTYSWGNEINSTLANYSESEMNGTVNVGNYLPNPWGFYDMHGNVSEWVREKHLGYPLSKDAEPKAGEGELSWLYRGGPWHFSSRYLRSAKRGVHPSSHSYYSVGMRLCLKKVPSSVFEKTAMSDQLDQGLETMEEKFDRLSKKEVGNGIHIVGFAANMEMIWCKPGDFVMGDENNSRNVTLTKGFFLGKYEVTQEEYQKVMGKNPSKFKGNKNRPVEKVTWFDAMEFCKKLTESEHKSDRLPKDWVFTLPTEAEWEYACRAGTTTRYSWGISIEPTLANYKASEIGGTLKVGNYKPNNWGIHDMHGNVGEWTKDWKAKYPKLNSTDPQGPESGTSRSVRGEFWFSDNLSTYGRGDVIPERRWGYVGFRICLKQLPENKQASMPVEGKPLDCSFDWS
jgi:formylglycine-generating enzyme required for sulfatase activity